MNLLNLIDEELRSIGGSQKAINEARHFAIALHCRTAESKEAVARELSQQEIEHFRVMIRMYFLAVLVSPEFRDEIRKNIKQQLDKN